MQRSPEVLIKRLRNRKLRIVGYTILSIAGVCLLATVWFVLVTMMADLVPEKRSDVQLYLVVQQSILPAIAFLESMSLLLAAGTGLSIGLLITEISGTTKTDLLVQLWDRVQALECSHPSNPKS